MLQCDLKGCEMNFDGEIVVYGQAGNFIYEVSRGILVDTKLSFDFSGRHEGCNFSGCCVTEKENSTYFGVGKFQYEGFAPYESRVELCVEVESEIIKITGIWYEGVDRYRISGELGRR